MTIKAHSHPDTQVNWITILKGILVIGIFTYHLGPITIPIAWGGYQTTFQFVIPPGPEIVEAFFMISGYLIGLSFLKRALSPSSLLSFYYRRVLRIVPSYFFIVLASFIFLRQYLQHNSILFLLRMLTFQGNNFLVLSQNNDPTWMSKTNVPLWFVSILLQLYIVSPFMYVFLSLGKKHPRAVFLSTIIMGLFLRYLILPSALPWTYASNFTFYQLSLLGNLIFFSAGMSLSFIKNTRATHAIRNSIYGIGSISVWWFIASYSNRYFDKNPLVMVYILPVVLVCAFSVFLYSVHQLNQIKAEGWRLMMLKLFEYFGNISYQFYLWHWVVILYLWNYVTVPPVFQNYGGIYVLAFIVTTVLSIGSYILFDSIHSGVRS